MRVGGELHSGGGGGGEGVLVGRGWRKEEAEGGGGGGGCSASSTSRGSSLCDSVGDPCKLQPRIADFVGVAFSNTSSLILLQMIANAILSLKRPCDCIS